jgi:hypothetical protein
MKILSKIAFTAIMSLSLPLLAQVSIQPAVIGGEIDMTNGQSVSLSISNTSGSSQSVSLSVGSGFSIQLNRCPSVLANNKVCNLRVAVNPAILASGTTTVDLMNGASSLVSLKYIKSTIAQVSSITTSPPSLSFGSLSRTGNSVPQTITITNTGNITLSPIIELSSKMSLVINRCSSLQAGKSCSISVSVAPTSDMSNGAISGQSVTIKKDAGDAGQVISATASLNITLACSGLQHQENSICVANVRICPITNGTGSQVWTGSWSSCALIGCNSGFINSGGSCVVPPEFVVDNFVTPVSGTVYSNIEELYNNYAAYISFTLSQRTLLDYLEMPLSQFGSGGSVSFRLSSQRSSVPTSDIISSFPVTPLLPYVIANSSDVPFTSIPVDSPFLLNTVRGENMALTKFYFTGVTLEPGTYYLSFNSISWSGQRIRMMMNNSGPASIGYSRWGFSGGFVLQNTGLKPSMRIRGTPVP